MEDRSPAATCPGHRTGQRKSPLLHQLSDGDGGEHLAHRRDVEAGVAIEAPGFAGLRMSPELLHDDSVGT